MQIIYTRTQDLRVRNEKAFSVAPGEGILLVLEQEETIKRLQRRSNFTTRACFNQTVIILFQSDYKYWNMEIPENIAMESFLILHDILYEVKPIPLIELINTDFLNREAEIYAYFNKGL